jgi:hypothetical protein
MYVDTAPIENILVIERLVAITLPTRNLTKRRIIGGDLKLLQADWKGDAERASGIQAFVNRLICYNGCTQVVSGPPTGEALLDINPLRHKSSLISCNILPEISDHNGVVLEVQWDEIFLQSKVDRVVDRIVPVCHKTDVFSLQLYIGENFNLWPGDGSSVEEIRKS